MTIGEQESRGRVVERAIERLIETGFECTGGCGGLGVDEGESKSERPGRNDQGQNERSQKKQNRMARAISQSPLQISSETDVHSPPPMRKIELHSLALRPAGIICAPKRELILRLTVKRRRRALRPMGLCTRYPTRLSISPTAVMIEADVCGECLCSS